MNNGLGGNRILHDMRGDSGLRRFDRDVLAQPGVTHAIVMLGTNDLRNRWAKPEEEVTAEQMIAGLQQMAVRAHSAGIKIIGATLTPFGNETFMANAWNPTRERHRVAVNAWIRESGAFDGVADFDAALRDPGDPDPDAARSMIAATACTRATAAIARWATRSTWRCSIRSERSEQRPMARKRKDVMPRHFGILVPSTNTTCEIEYCRLPAELQVHTGRLGKGGNTPFSPSLDADVAYQAKLLGEARVEVIALAQTSASLFADDYDAVTVKRMTEASGVPSLTSAQAIGRALKALKASRIAMATPYSEEVIGRARRYYETKYGIAVVASESLGAANAYAIGKMDAGMAEAAFRRIDRPDVDALVVPGGNFPTMDWIAAWERQFGKPVITTNQAALWAVLQTMKFDTPLPGKGRLLEQLPAG